MHLVFGRHRLVYVGVGLDVVRAFCESFLFGLAYVLSAYYLSAERAMTLRCVTRQQERVCCEAACGHFAPCVILFDS